MSTTKWALETVLEFAEKWADSKRRNREAFDEAAPILRAALSKPESVPQAEGHDVAAEIAAAESRGRAEEREACALLVRDFDEAEYEESVSIVALLSVLGERIRARGEPRAAPSEIPQEKLRAPALTPSDPEKGRAQE